ncbi:MAG: alpha/beta hydrolase [Microbacterium sp.]|uniref:alpha/beta fold hydrolase n=1 Tax=Microbacterium sp. TaxID=51671 RepID=UPI0039E38B5F
MTTERLTHDGATLVAESHGAGERSFVLVHGIGMGRSVFAELANCLSPHGRVVAVDLPGFGEAPEPPRTPTMERMGDILAAFLRRRALADVVLVGHSMGTQVAVEATVRHPGLVNRIVLIGPTVNPRERDAARQLLRLGQDLADDNPLVLLRGAREYLRAGPHLRRKMRAMLAHRPELSYPRVRVPTLVMRGERDRVVPREWAREASRLIPGSVLAEIPERGHEAMIHRAEPAARAIIGFCRGGQAAI